MHAITANNKGEQDQFEDEDLKKLQKARVATKNSEFNQGSIKPRGA